MHGPMNVKICFFFSKISCLSLWAKKLGWEVWKGITTHLLKRKANFKCQRMLCIWNTTGTNYPLGFFCTSWCTLNSWNKSQLMSLFQFYLYSAGSPHVSGPQAHPQESSRSCSHNHWFSVCTALAVCSVCCTQHTEHTARAVPTLNQWLCEQLCELSWGWACGPETCRDPAIYK